MATQDRQLPTTIENLLIAILLLAMLVSCKRTSSSSDYSFLPKIVLPSGEMPVYRDGKLRMERMVSGDGTFIHYIDRDACSACSMKSAYQWDDLMEEVGDSLKVVTIVTPDEESIGDLVSVLGGYYVGYPVFFDVDGEFERLNLSLLGRVSHDFLTDSENRICLAGNPLTDKGVRKKLSRLLRDR